MRLDKKNNKALRILLGLALASQTMMTSTSSAYAEEGPEGPANPHSGEFANISMYYDMQKGDMAPAPDKIYNGISEGVIYDNENDSVIGQDVVLNEGTYSGNFYMAKAVETDNNNLNLDGNVVNINGGTFNDWIEIGSGAAKTSDDKLTDWGLVGTGTINLSGGTFGPGVTLRGGVLNVYNTGLSVGHIGNFNRINFFIPGSAVSNDTMLTLTLDGYNSLSPDLKPQVNAYLSGDSALNLGDTINLITTKGYTDDETGITSGDFSNFDIDTYNIHHHTKAYMGVSKEYDMSLGVSEDKRTINAILGGITEAKGDMSKYYNEQANLEPDYGNTFTESSSDMIIDEAPFVKDQVVELSGGTFDGSISMAGAASTLMSIDGNTINIKSGDFTKVGSIASGASENDTGENDDWAKVGNGTINLWNGTFGQNTILKGGTLNVFNKGLSVGHLASFNTINFFVPESAVNADTMLTLTGTDYNSLQYLDSNVHAYFNGNSSLTTGDSVKLLTVADGVDGDFGNLKLEKNIEGEGESSYEIPVTTNAYVGVSKKYYAFLSTTEDKKTVVANLVNVTGEEGPENPDPSEPPEEPEESPTKENDEKHNEIYGVGEGANIGQVIEEGTAAIVTKDGKTISTAVFNSTDDVKNKSVWVYSGEYEGEIAVANDTCGTVDNNRVVVGGGTFKDSAVINAGKLGTDGKGGSVSILGGDFASNVEIKASNIDIQPEPIWGEVGGAEPVMSRGYSSDIIGAKNYTMGKLTGVDNLNIWVSKGNKAGDTILTLTDAKPLDTDNVTVRGYFEAGSKLKKYDQIKLLTLSNPQANLNNVSLVNPDNINDSWYNWTTGVSIDTPVLLTKNDNSVVATIGATKDTLRYETKSLVESNMASIASINNNADVLVDMGYSSAAEAVAAMKNSDASAANSFAPYAAIGYSKLKQNSGSYVNTKGVGFNIGFAKEISSGGSKMIFGPFVEYGRGSYDSHLEDQCDTRGDGKTRSVGIGAMIRSENNDGMYYEGSLRFGRVTTDFDSVNMVPDLGIRCQYDTTNNYYGAHVGIGKVLQLNDKSKLDVYGKLFLTQMEGHSVHLSTGENYEFDNVNSIRSRLGFRYTTNMGEKSKFYGGLAWQHEFDGTSSATYLHPTDPSRNLNTPSPSVKGNTAMLELGVLLANSNNFSVDLGLRGYAGKQQGSAVNARFNWSF